MASRGLLASKYHKLSGARASTVSIRPIFTYIRILSGQMRPRNFSSARSSASRLTRLIISA
jgi:hypothetical protein